MSKNNTVVCKVIPPLSFFLSLILGGLLLRRIPKPSNSYSMIFLCCKGFNASKTMKISEHVLATAITCLPRPLPSLAPSMIPGKSSN